MTPFEFPDYGWLTTLARSPLFLLAIAALALLEAGWRLRHGKGYSRRELGLSIGVFVGQLICNAPGMLLMLGLFVGVGSVIPYTWAMDSAPQWFGAFLLVEFAYYWQHRMSHQVPWFWATHAVHHSAQEFALPAALRLGWTSWLSGAFLPMLFPVIVGVPPIVVLLLLALNLRYQYFIHTEAVRSLGPLEWVLNTPSHHRVHHGANPEYLDANFGGVLILFDRLFGTFVPERTGLTIRYGRHDVDAGQTVVGVAFHEWRRLLTVARTSGGVVAAIRRLFTPTPRGTADRA
ncbi:MAG: sterol desaturase family protein [Pseudomonadota bacterium]